jgi:hypothetical protein
MFQLLCDRSYSSTHVWQKEVANHSRNSLHSLEWGMSRQAIEEEEGRMSSSPLLTWSYNKEKSSP